MKRNVLLPLLLVLVYSAAHAQGQKIEGVQWYQVLYARFKPGAAAEARQIILENFFPAEREIGREVLYFEGATGEWDFIGYFPMSEGPGALAYESTAEDQKFFEALGRQAGSPAKAEEVFQRWWSLVDHWEFDLMKRRFP